MTVISEKITEMNGYKLHIVKTEKYKTNTIVWKMKAPLNEDTVTLRALLPYVLQSKSESYPSTSELRSYLDELYGASFYVDLAKKGEYHIISFSLEIANEKFLSDPTPLLKKAFEFMTEILFKPKQENQSFETETIENEKRSLKQRIQSVFDDKMRYSNFRLVEEMCKGESYSLHVHGKMDDVDSITPASLYQYYLEAFAEDELDLYVIGDVNDAEVENIASELFTLENRTPQEIRMHQLVKKPEVHEVREVQDIKQGKLNIGYRTNILYGDQGYYALQLFNGIFGGFSHSKLFHHVREKNSLAYYVASRLESHKGVMMVMSGIDNKNYQQAIDIIREQLDAMKKGDFTEQEVEQTLAVIQNQLLETIDTSRGIVEILYHNVVANKNISLDEWIEQMKKVTKEEIVNVASQIELDTIYFLTGAEA